MQRCIDEDDGALMPIAYDDVDMMIWWYEALYDDEVAYYEAML